MAKCPDCGKDVNRANGCSVCEIEINGEWYEKLKFGTDDDYYHWADEKNRCPDCGAKLATASASTREAVSSLPCTTCCS